MVQPRLHRRQAYWCAILYRRRPAAKPFRKQAVRDDVVEPSGWVLSEDDRDRGDAVLQHVVVYVAVFIAVEVRQHAPDDHGTERRYVPPRAVSLASGERVEKIDERSSVAEIPSLRRADIEMSPAAFVERVPIICIVVLVVAVLCPS